LGGSKVFQAVLSAALRLDLPNQASVQKKPRTLFRTRRYFIRIGHVALSEHDGTLRIHHHHPAQHAGGHLRVAMTPMNGPTS
jgi:hypothetical protein